MTDNSRESLLAAAREYLAGAERALSRGAWVSAARETTIAAQWCVALFRHHTDPQSQLPEYRQGYEDMARELAKLPPALLRRAAEIAGIQGQDG